MIGSVKINVDPFKAPYEKLWYIRGIDNGCMPFCSLWYPLYATVHAKRRHNRALHTVSYIMFIYRYKLKGKYVVYGTVFIISCAKKYIKNIDAVDSARNDTFYKLYVSGK